MLKRVAATTVTSPGTVVPTLPTQYTTAWVTTAESLNYARHYQRKARDQLDSAQDDLELERLTRCGGTRSTSRRRDGRASTANWSQRRATTATPASPTRSPWSP